MTVLHFLPRRQTPKRVPEPAFDPTARRLIACRVRVRTQAGQTFRYHALVDHTCAAVADALDYFGQWCSVSVAPCEFVPMAANGGRHVQR